MRQSVLAVMLMGVAGISGCSSMPGNPGSDAAGRGAAGSAQKDGDTASLSRTVFYFPLDGYEISPADRAVLLAHGRYLAAHPKVKVFIQGNADERGTHEYNLALGERRAQAIESLLRLQGVPKANTESISFGRENPVAFCHDESCWSLNRRVELIYPD